MNRHEFKTQVMTLRHKGQTVTQISQWAHQHAPGYSSVDVRAVVLAAPQNTHSCRHGDLKCDPRRRCKACDAFWHGEKCCTETTER